MCDINPLNVLDLLITEYSRSYTFGSEITDAEKELKRQLHSFIESCLRCSDTEFTEDEQLIFSSEADEHVLNKADFDCELEEEDCLERSRSGSESSQPVSSGSSEYLPTPPLAKPLEFVEFKYKQKAVEYWRSGAAGKPRPMKFVAAQFKRLKNDGKTIYRWAQQVDEMGSRIDKLVQIYNETLQRFQAAKKKRYIVHDADLKRWAVQANASIKLADFVASGTFLRKFKKVNRIVSRKVTKFISRLYINDKKNLADAAREFVTGLEMEALELPDPFDICNGVRGVEAVVQSPFGTTHSYTIMPIITADGRVVKPLFICMQEVNGEFGPIVKERMKEVLSSEVHVVASKSGKMSKDLFLDEWYSQCLLPNVGTNSIVLLDSFPVHKDTDSMKSITPEEYENLKIRVIPPGTTGMI
ncbi:hypothetical protein BV898_19649 [Hypsibius exemplaris]|uniref:DDE-1 domain-containing protein n=1 Tax=Hypsibius exemplaris TaxID=2072580 RepID=A0A9X6RPB0_HYPEX|nr:hypothetical protein BV898_19649 [Hypsibius exemplaris]